MSTPMQSSVVRIYSNNGFVVGAGFLVSQKYILTCAHVVATALGIATNTAEMPNAEVCLDFPLLELNPKPSFKARIVFWRPVKPNEFAEDIAGLELESSPSNTAQPARLVAVQEFRAHTYKVMGFPKNQSNGVWSDGVMKGKIANGWIQLENTKQTGYALEPGFSGAPIWDEQLQGVAGMAVAADMDRTAAKAAFMIPAQVLVEAWPVLQDTLSSTIPSLSQIPAPSYPKNKSNDFKLSGQQRKELQEAFIDAFPSKLSLEQMLSFELDKNLDGIAGGNNLGEIVFNLIKYAQSQGWIEELVRAALNSNPGNPTLKAIAEELLTGL